MLAWGPPSGSTPKGGPAISAPQPTLQPTNGTPATGLLRPRQHFEALDGLRGVAAVCVVIFHFMEMAIFDYSKNFIGHGFLAVDFFFCLSGFVIAYAYDDRLQRMGLRQFFLARLIRLHPLVISGSVFGLLAFLFDPFAPHLPALYGPGRIILIFLSSIFLIPYPAMTERTFNLFSFNAPAWSLFWEYIANLAYALVLIRLPRRALGGVAVLGAVWLGFIAHRANTLSGGWGGSTFWDGPARVTFSFTAGMLVYRCGWIIRSRFGFTALSILLIAAFCFPYPSWNGLAEWLVVVFFFPLLVALGAGATLSPASIRLSIFSGNISYPLYMTHYLAIWAFMNYYAAFHPDNRHLALIVTTGVLLLFGFSWLVMVVYDIPVRTRLTAALRRPTPAAPVPPS